MEKTREKLCTWSVANEIQVASENRHVQVRLRQKLHHWWKLNTCDFQRDLKTQKHNNKRNWF